MAVPTMDKPKETNNGIPLAQKTEDGRIHIELSAKIEPFDSFWEGPEDIESGYDRFGLFYRDNYMPYIPKDKAAKILVISCGPGYMLNVLKEEGFTNVLGLDSFEYKVEYAQSKGFNALAEPALDYLANTDEVFDIIFCEQELNHLTKDEILMFLKMAWEHLREEGLLIVHGLNGANPITGSEALAQNFDHFNTFTEYTLRQILALSGFGDVKVFGLNLYVFRNNPFNYVAAAISYVHTLYFIIMFKLYGKFNRIFTKKIAAVGRKKLTPQPQPHG